MIRNFHRAGNLFVILKLFDPGIKYAIKRSGINIFFDANCNGIL